MNPAALSPSDAAMLRAYTLARCLDYGCSIDDVLALHRRLEAGRPWVETAVQLAEDDLARADRAQLGGCEVSARAFRIHAAACFRLAQAALELEPAKRLACYRRMREAFARAMASSPDTVAGFDVVHRGARHRAWLFAAPDGGTGQPCVIVWGGADGWCEAFHPSVVAFHEKALSVCLVELPGQGLARLEDGSFLRPDFPVFVSTLIDALAGRGLGETGFGVVGHSLGGSLAVAAAAADRRITACCTNGGSVSPAVGLSRYPRVMERVGRMLGPHGTADEAVEFFEALQLPDAVRSTTAALLCLHGGQDVLVGDDETASLVALRNDADTTLERWPDGVHCLYDVAFERNSVMTTWFASRLRR